MDRRGEGVPLIISRTLELSGQLPQYRLIDNNELLLYILKGLAAETAIYMRNR